MPWLRRRIGRFRRWHERDFRTKDQRAHSSASRRLCDCLSTTGARCWPAAPEREALATQGLSALADDVEITGIGEKSVPSLPRSFFYGSNSHQVVKSNCNCGNREFERFGGGRDVRNRLPLHVFVD